MLARARMRVGGLRRQALVVKGRAGTCGRHLGGGLWLAGWWRERLPTNTLDMHQKSAFPRETINH